jgi:uncharacterized membrane protein HdeD (DUF308 family)
MLAMLNNVPVLGHPVFRIVLGIAVIVIAVTLVHHSIILIALGALILIMGLVRGARSLSSRPENGELR